MDKRLTTESADPVALFREWLADAEKQEAYNPDAVALATATAEGIPTVRMVLLKGVEENGFVFYTNSESRKGHELAENPHASMCFYWKSLRRQVRIDGAVEKAGDEISDAYFATRSRASQIGAWASMQSRPLEGRFELEKRIAVQTTKFAVGAVPRPPFWEGYRLLPRRIEFWAEQKFRLHDRIVYDRAGDGWTVQRLYP